MKRVRLKGHRCRSSHEEEVPALPRSSRHSTARVCHEARLVLDAATQLTALLLTLTSAAAAGTLYAPDVMVFPGQSAASSVWLSSGHQPVAAVQFDLEWDMALQGIQVAAGTQVEAAAKVLYTAARGSSGLRCLIVGENRNVLADGELVRLNVTVSSTAAPGGFQVRFTNLLGASPEGTPVSLEAGTTIVQIQSLATAQGGPLRFVAVTPCRVVDTRVGEGKTGPFGPPSLDAGQTREIRVPQGTCGIPSTARAYTVNVTVVPVEPLSYLSVGPTGQPHRVSTLNSMDGRIVANAAIVPAGADGSISVYVTNRTDVIIDVNGFFVP
ncbi:MAG: hypothetical protein ACKV22_03735 [Bryobacteraceae bacterium]